MFVEPVTEPIESAVMPYMLPVLALICAVPSDALPTVPAAIRVLLKSAVLFLSVKDLIEDVGLVKSDVAVGWVDRSLRTPAKTRLSVAAPPIVTPPMLPIVRTFAP